jgi:hypothetical protein
LFVAAWLLTSALELALMLSLGHGLVLPMEKGSQHRTGLDLLAAGALLALGLREVLNAGEEGESPAWSRRLAGFGALPLLPLLGLSSLVQVVSPDDLFLYAKASGNLLAAGLDRSREWLVGGFFTLSTAVLLLVPLLAMAVLGRERVIPGLEGGKSWLLRNADPLVGLVSLALAAGLALNASLIARAEREPEQLLAEVCARNRFAALRLLRQLPEAGQERFSCVQAGRTLEVLTQVSAAGNPDFRQVRVQIRQPESAGGVVLLNLATVLGRY